MRRKTFSVTRRSLEARALAIKLMAQHGLYAWSFCFTNAKRQAGVCQFGKKWIGLSVHFCERNDLDTVRNTILHEIAHALAGPSAGHGPEWQRVCVRIGAKPERCYDTGVEMPEGRWHGQCPNCKKTHRRHRKPRSGGGVFYHCRKCGPVLGKIVWERV